MKKKYKLTDQKNAVRGKWHIRNDVLVLILPFPCAWCVKNLCSWLKVPIVKWKCFAYFQKFVLNCYCLVESSLFINILQIIKQNYGKEQLGVKAIFCVMDH
jgi:hypothetical protein